MKEQARLTLESVIQLLDQELPPRHRCGSYKAEVEQLKPDDEERLHQDVLYLNAILADTQGLEDSVAKKLIGENILTPSLVTKGWMFWKQPLLTESEKKAIESAVVRCAQAKAAQAKTIKDTFDRLPSKDTHASVVMLASLADVALSYIQQLSTDLKEVLLKAKTGRYSANSARTIAKNSNL